MKKTYVTIQVLIVLTAIAPGFLGQVMAAPKIGAANTVVKSVSGEIERKRSPINTGDRVFLNEVIRTESRSSTKIVFDDRTILSIGSKSVVVLDEFVYRPGSRSNRIVLNVARGALRFVTGDAKSSAYRINTPTATIGVRGTDFDVYIDRFKSTLLLLRDGLVRICRKGVADIWAPLTRTNCRDLIAARTFVLVTAGSISGPFDWDGRSPMDILFDNRPKGAGTGDNEDDDPAPSSPNNNESEDY